MHTPPLLTRRLDNGLLAVALQRPGDTALLNVDVRVGSRFESRQDHGLSHFLEHMIFQGSASVPAPADVNRRAERMGAAFDAWTARDSSRYSHWLDPKRLPESATLLADLLHRPVFSELESERAIIVEESLDEFDEDGRLVDADTIARRALWPKSPLGQNVIGSQENLQRFTRADLQRHHAHFFGARNMVLTVAGPDAPAALLDAVAGPFSALPAGEARTPEPAGAAPLGPVVEQVEDGQSQVEVRLLFRTPGRHHADAPALRVLRRALDDGLSARLHRRLGSELGLAYSLWAVWERYSDSGAFEIGASVSPAKVTAFVEESQALLRGLATAPPTGDELDHVRFRTAWAARCNADQAEGLVSMYGTPHLFEAEPAHPADRLAAALAVTTDELARVADATFRPDEHVACFVGPLDKPVRRALKGRVRAFGRG
ncbi:MAG: pitrilysin family protein [bacterium]